jgi:hypothetical protein
MQRLHTVEEGTPDSGYRQIPERYNKYAMTSDGSILVSNVHTIDIS